FFQLAFDTVLHVAATMNEPYDTSSGIITGRALMYFRRVLSEDPFKDRWDNPPYVVDTIETFGYDLAGQPIGDRVSLVWSAALPYDDPYCDTCSGLHNNVYPGLLIGQMDNDVYYQESWDQGESWEPRVNITQTPIGEAAYKAYTDISAVYDGADNLHIVWPALPWPADDCIKEGGGCFAEEQLVWKGWNVDKARLMHWSQNAPYMRPVCDHTYDPIDSCGPGKWALRVAKPSISACDGKLYTIWTQFNNQRDGVIDDCAEWRWDQGGGGYEGFDYYPDRYSGSANGEIWLSVSADGGVTWDNQRNLSNS
ncbi:MAG: hypothetical protein JSU74_02035, partial [Candidatus Zixiibacteriota bacterium]